MSGMHNSIRISYYALLIENPVIYIYIYIYIYTYIEDGAKCFRKSNGLCKVKEAYIVL